METIKRLLKNTIAVILARCIQPLFSIIFVLIIVRRWIPEDFGKYITVFYLLSIFKVLCAFGLRNTLTRDVAKHRDLVQKYMNSGFIIALPFSILSMLLMIGVVHVLNFESEVTMAANILSISLIAFALSECFEGILAGFERIQSIAIIWTLETILSSGIRIALILSGFGLISIVIVHVIIRFLNAIAYYFIIQKSIVRIQWEFNLKFIKQLLKTTYIFALILLVSALSWRIDAVILPKIKGDLDVALFGAAHRIFVINRMIILSFFTAFFPMISRLFSERKESFQMACRKSIQYLSIINFAVALFMTVFSKDIVLIFFREKYLDAAPALIINFWAILILAIGEVFGYTLLASNNQKIELRMNIIELICKLILTYILISRYSFVGAAVATLLSLIIKLGFQFHYIEKNVVSLRFRRLAVQGLRLIVAGCVMMGIVYLLKQQNPVIVFIISLLSYISVLFMTRIFSSEDIFFFKTLYNTYIIRRK